MRLNWTSFEPSGFLSVLQARSIRVHDILQDHPFVPKGPVHRTGPRQECGKGVMRFSLDLRLANQTESLNKTMGHGKHGTDSKDLERFYLFQQLLVSSMHRQKGRVEPDCWK